MYKKKFWKMKEDRKVTPIEQNVATALLELEQVSDIKNELKDIFIDKVTEVEVTYKNKQNKNVVLVFIPFVCLKIYQKVAKRLIDELEKKMKQPFVFVAKRKIQSRWIKEHRSQKRPRNRTLTAVHEAILDDLCLPSSIVAKRVRVRVNGSKFFKIFLDEADRKFMEDKVEALQQVYQKLTAKQIVIDFKEEKPFYVIKK